MQRLPCGDPAARPLMLSHLSGRVRGRGHMDSAKSGPAWALQAIAHSTNSEFAIDRSQAKRYQVRQVRAVILKYNLVKNL